MYNQTELILAQYEIEICGITKGRGTFLCDTNKGMKLLVPFRGSKEKGMLLREFLTGLNQTGFVADEIELNLSQEAVTEDENTEERFILKNYVEGTEINTGRAEDMKEAVKVLALFHNASERIHVEMPEQMTKENVVESYRRHYRELIKARNYIRNRKKKCEFEQIYMKNFEHNRASAEQSLMLLEAGKEDCPRSLFCHGDFNQHNVLLSEGQYRLVHYENFVYNWGILDLVNFLRKMLEKNEWNEVLGRELIMMYDRYRPLEEAERKRLYGLLLFPEKFWKVTNHYMNSRKSWISEKDVEKLKKVIELEEKRLNFMENIFAFLR